jgi:pilus assembly protein CpaE
MRCEIFGVIGAIGNPGATTVAIALADALNQETKTSTSELCLIDLDFASGACGAYLDVANEFDFDTIFTAPERIDLELLELICHRHPTGFDLLSVRRPDFLLSSRQDNFVLQLLDVASYRYKRIVLDLPSYPTSWTAALIAELDRLVIVTETSIPAIKSAKQRFDEAASIRQTDKGIAVLANREKRRFLSRELTRSDVVEGLGRDDVDFLPEDRALITEALNRGVLPVQARASAPFNKQVKRFVRKLRGEEKT